MADSARRRSRSTSTANRPRKSRRPSPLSRELRKERKAAQLAEANPGVPVEALANVDFSHLVVDVPARTAFEREHRTDGVRGVRDAVSFLAASANVEVEEDGTLVLFSRGFRIPLSADASHALAYATVAGGYPLRELSARSAAGCSFDPEPLTPSGLVAVLGDDGIDSLDIHVSALSLPDGELSQPYFAEDIRDALAAGLDVLEDALESHTAPPALLAARPPRRAVRLAGTYAWLPSGEHEVTALGWTLRLAPNGSRVCSAAYAS